MRTNQPLELLNADGLDDSITKDYYAVDGGDGGDEDATDYEGEESEVGGVPPQDLPKFRDLVRAKKLELKGQWGKGHFKNETTTERSCKNVPYPCPTWKNPLKVCHKEICVNVPKIRVVWVSGWRKKWREFKQSGGLAQLKIQSQTPVIPPAPTTPPPTQNVNVGTPNIASISEIGAIVRPPRTLKFIDTGIVSIKENAVKSAPVTEEKKESTNTDWQKEESNPSSPRTAQKGVESTSMSEEKKFLGMPRNIGIAVAVVGAAAIGFGIYKLVKK